MTLGNRLFFVCTVASVFTVENELICGKTTTTAINHSYSFAKA